MVAQLAERPSEVLGCCKSTNVGSNPGCGIRWLEIIILAMPSGDKSRNSVPGLGMLQIHRGSGRKKSAVASWNKQEVSKIFCLITSHNFNLLEQITQSTNYVGIIAQPIIL